MISVNIVSSDEPYSNCCTDRVLSVFLFRFLGQVSKLNARAITSGSEQPGTYSRPKGHFGRAREANDLDFKFGFGRLAGIT